MTDITPPADDKIHSATDDEQAIEDDQKLQQEEKDGELTQDEKDRLDAHL